MDIWFNSKISLVKLEVIFCPKLPQTFSSQLNNDGHASVKDLGIMRFLLFTIIFVNYFEPSSITISILF